MVGEEQMDWLDKALQETMEYMKKLEKELKDKH